MRLGTYLGLIPGYVSTVLLEGLLLFLITLVIKRKPLMTISMKTSAIMNFFSYMIILFGILIVDFMTKGANFEGIY